jgi:cell division protein FtsN
LSAPRHAQHGGTILGVILGILFGLAVAVAVALYVGKVPVPFTNHNQPRTPAQDAEEAERNRNWDPNSPLGGRGSGVRQPSVTGTIGGASAPAEDDPTSMPPAPVLVPDSDTAQVPTPPASKEKPSTPKPSEDPLGDLLRERAGRAANTNSGDPFTYYVQAGAFRAAADAEAQRARLSLLGIQARVTEREQAGRTVYRVRVGPFDNKDAADRAKAQLDSSNVESALVRVQR